MLSLNLKERAVAATLVARDSRSHRVPRRIPGVRDADTTVFSVLTERFTTGDTSPGQTDSSVLSRRSFSVSTSTGTSARHAEVVPATLDPDRKEDAISCVSSA